MATGISLHIGLNKVDPAQYGGWDGELVACEQDAHDMARLARAAGFGDTTLLTPDGTVDNVTKELRKAAKRLKSGDIMLFTYSGHGGQVPDAEGSDDERDEFDETLVLFDRQFLDDELHREFGRFAEGVRIAALLDCCHSGSGIEVRDVLTPEAMQEQFQTRDPDEIENASRLMPVAKQVEIYQRDQQFFQEIQRGLGDKQARNDGVNALLISACQDNQLASDGPVNGAFTGTLLDVWDNGAFRGGYRAFHRDILERMPATQSPNFYVTGRPDDRFLEERPFTV
ncbi:caspase family protein [Streptomyces sp. ISL-98]|uniref:caspase family protein n=1 Tax=Streptomyces sp. ISL-98 TaxID=2819192 RepID=UPI001BE6008D|nr:caspase family protein [Streptomyces sp. ISL-98]MBT2511686.1 caspase family protein [Streptomyces sp. ISL-98]